MTRIPILTVIFVLLTYLPTIIFLYRYHIQARRTENHIYPDMWHWIGTSWYSSTVIDADTGLEVTDRVNGHRKSGLSMQL